MINTVARGGVLFPSLNGRNTLGILIVALLVGQPYVSPEDLTLGSNIWSFPSGLCVDLALNWLLLEWYLRLLNVQSMVCTYIRKGSFWLVLDYSGVVFPNNCNETHQLLFSVSVAGWYQAQLWSLSLR